MWTSARNDLTLAAFYQRVIATVQLMWKLIPKFCETHSLVTIMVYACCRLTDTRLKSPVPKIDEMGHRPSFFFLHSQFSRDYSKICIFYGPYLPTTDICGRCGRLMMWTICMLNQ